MQKKEIKIDEDDYSLIEEFTDDFLMDVYGENMSEAEVIHGMFVRHDDMLIV